ncbi:Protein yippee-like protein [Diplodia seriata]|uniref:Protein yippee-like protein n=1 Tax=Diplodia seriata TaxID=420778 RepID=A0A1S8B2A4_9PEZI|nr:Protein yippee-like protein [Diplodia seriata]
MLSAPSPFPLYLLPSIPFRRRRSSTETTATVTSDAFTTSTSPPAATAAPSNYLRGNRSHLRCTRCLTDLCLTSQIISKGFTGRHGRAYLVAPPRPYPDNTATSDGGGISAVSHRENNLPNTYAHKPVPRQLVTGAHTVSDISCALCGAVLGWKYVAADEDSQKYKVGKFILETKRVCRGVRWENEDGDASDASPPQSSATGTKRAVSDASSEDEDIEFDSQDEDECEDLFAGVWSPSLAKRRRRGRAWREGRNGASGVEEV